MGAAVSVTVANVTNREIQQKALDTFSSRSALFLRYVEDGYWVVKTSKIDPFQKHLNSIEPAIQFTLELQSGGCLPFLDVRTVRRSNRLPYEVYKKQHTPADT